MYYTSEIIFRQDRKCAKKFDYVPKFLFFIGISFELHSFRIIVSPYMMKGKKDGSSEYQTIIFYRATGEILPVFEKTPEQSGDAPPDHRFFFFGPLHGILAETPGR